MAYSNGYEVTAVTAALFKRLGWSGDSTLNADNKTSNSGRYFDDGSFHSLVTVDSLRKIAPIGGDVDVFFDKLQKAAIYRALTSVFTKSEFVDQLKAYEPDELENNIELPNTGKAAGYFIEIPKSYDKTVQIKALELYFNGAVTFNVYLFKQGSATAVKTKSVTTVAGERTRFDLTDWYLNYKDAANWYILYFQADLGSVKAIQELAEDNEGMYIDFDHMLATATGATTFDRSSRQEPGYPQGLNLEIISFNDFTRNIVNQPHLFDNLIGLNMAYQCIEAVIYTTNSNAAERKLRDDLNTLGLSLDLTGTAPISGGPYAQGLKQRIDKEAERVRKAFYPDIKMATVQCS